MIVSCLIILVNALFQLCNNDIDCVTDISTLPSLGLKSLLESVEDLGDDLDAGIVAHHSDPPDLAGAGAQTSGDLHKVTAIIIENRSK